MSKLCKGPSKDAPYQVSIHFVKRFQRRRFFRNQPIRNKNCLSWPCLLNNLYKGPSKDASYQISIHLAKQLQRRRFFRNQPIRNKNCLWWPCLINRSGRNKQFLERTCHRCFLLNFGSFGQVVSEKKIFLNRPIRNKNCLWWPCLLTDRN